MPKAKDSSITLKAVQEQHADPADPEWQITAGRV